MRRIKIIKPGVRHPVLESYGTILPTDVACPECGTAVYHGSKKKDSADATLPKSIYACKCAYFSSSQLVLPLRAEEWAREVKRSITQGGSADAKEELNRLSKQSSFSEHLEGETDTLEVRSITEEHPAPEQPQVDSETLPMGDTLPMGNTTPEVLAAGKVKPPSKAEVNRYKKILAEIRTDIDLIDHTVARLGRNLQQIRDKQLYFCGGYATFKDFCEKELGKSRQQVFRLIQAYDTITMLMEAGLGEHELPATERLLREVRKVEPDYQAPVWRAVLKAVKQQGRKPMVSDVQAAAVDLIQSPSAIERQQSELLHRFEGAARGLKVGLAIELLTPSFKLKLIGVLMQISESVQIMIQALKSSALDECQLREATVEEGSEKD
jgi:hypothetical protein